MLPVWAGVQPGIVPLKPYQQPEPINKIKSYISYNIAFDGIACWIRQAVDIYFKIKNNN